MIPADVIALFVKPPVPGRVKTRLGQAIGHGAACRVYVRMVELILEHIRQSQLPLVICYDGDDPAALPQQWQRYGIDMRPQRGETLGERMAETFTGLFAAGARRVILVGSDIPGIDSNYLRSAMEKLQSHQMVIAPAVDGGYGLIGFRHDTYRPEIFQNIPWSTDQVYPLTMTVFARQGDTPAILPLVRDVDTLEDLRHYPEIFTEGDLHV